MRYVEYALKVEGRNGTMIPVSSLPNLFDREDAGYCSVYQFDQAAAWAIRAQGHSQGMARFSVYADRLWIDIDRDDVLDEQGNVVQKGVEIAREYTRQLTKQFMDDDYAFSVWLSGGKGFHICIKITPMEGKDVPYSQAQWCKERELKCDYSLYMHSRLFSNPGRKHPKTGIRKHKIFEHKGKTVLEIPMLKAPEKTVIDSGILSAPELSRIWLARVESTIAAASLIDQGNRHQRYWSLAMAGLEAGISPDLITSVLCWVDKFLPSPKGREGIERAVAQAITQSGVTE